MRQLLVAMTRAALVGAVAFGGLCALGWWALTPAPPVDASALFTEHVVDLMRLRDLIRGEGTCSEISIDHYEAREADGHTRWIDETPTADVLASICAMPRARADEYLSLMRRTGVIRVFRDRPAAHGVDDVLMILEMHGIVTSGGETDLVWRREPPPASSGSAASGSAYVALDSADWYVKYEWD